MDRFSQISQECARRAWALAYSLVRNASDADDVVQRAFLVAWQRREVIPDDPWPWFAVVVSHSVRNSRREAARRTRREERLQHLPMAKNYAPGQSLEQEELRDLILAALAELPEEEREAVALCHIGGLTQVQASQASGVNLNTLKSRVQRGLERLRTRLQKQAKDVEAYLATIAVPVPVGGWEQAITRWKSSASAETIRSGLTLMFAAKLVAGLALPGAVLLAVFLMLNLGAKPSPTLVSSASPPNDLRAIPPVSPAEESDSSMNEARSRARSVQLPIEVSPDLAPVDPTEHKALSPNAEPISKQVLSPLPGTQVSWLRVRTSYYESGQLYMQWIEEVTPKGAILQGSYVGFHPNGFLWQEGQYLNNEREGLWTSRHDTGALESQGVFRSGFSEGVWTWWYSNGTTSAKGEYQQDLRQGEWRYWHANGHQKTIMLFKDGLAEGESTHFDESGRKVRTTTWHKGKRHGPETEFDQDGNPLPPK